MEFSNLQKTLLALGSLGGGAVAAFMGFFCSYFRDSIGMTDRNIMAWTSY
jgi:hypothetical protein